VQTCALPISCSVCVCVCVCVCGCVCVCVERGLHYFHKQDGPSSMRQHNPIHTTHITHTRTRTRTHTHTHTHTHTPISPSGQESVLLMKSLPSHPPSFHYTNSQLIWHWCVCVCDS